MKYIKSNHSYRQKCFNVELIITRRIKGKKKFYLIKWEGYPITDCSWEPISHLSNVNDIVKEFDNNFPNSINHKYLKEFKLELKKNNEKIKKFKKIMENSQSNKIIIELDDIDLNDINIDKEIEGTKNENDTIIEEKYDENKNLLIEKKNDINDYFKNDGKLIRPILIWQILFLIEIPYFMVI